MESREQFEAWLEREQGLYGEDIEWQPERNCYAKFGIHLAWCSWQESRNVEIELPAVEKWRHHDAVRAQNAYKAIVTKYLADARFKVKGG